MASARLASFISRTITAVSPARVGGLTAIKRRSRSRLNRWNGNESERLESRALLVNSISVFAEVPQAYESNQAPGLFTIHRDGDLTYGLLVNIGLDGFENNETTVATNGVDYNFVGPQVFFSPGISDVSISIVPILDSIVESEKCRVSGHPWYRGVCEWCKCFCFNHRCDRASGAGLRPAQQL